MGNNSSIRKSRALPAVQTPDMVSLDQTTSGSSSGVDVTTPTNPTFTFVIDPNKQTCSVSTSAQGGTYLQYNYGQTVPGIESLYETFTGNPWPLG